MTDLRIGLGVDLHPYVDAHPAGASRAGASRAGSAAGGGEAGSSAASISEAGSSAASISAAGRGPESRGGGSVEDDRRQLVLGGARFEGERPLRGHSDADVVAHAVADAVLGAAGLGDLGTHFPDTDDRWRGADSLDLLSAVVGRAGEEGWSMVNADCTLVGERPRIAPRREEMIERLSRAAGGPVHVKATRPEGLGSIGRLEGLACFAVVLLERSAETNGR